MSVLKVKDIRNSLIVKGFHEEENRKHIFYHLLVGGKKTTIRTHVSHGETEIYDDLIDSMKKQTKLNKNEFLDLINCPLSKEKYIEILIERGHVSI